MTTIEDLEIKTLPLRTIVSQFIELPEPARTLDIASRKKDETRIFKYLHQMCSIHAANFTRANQVKLVVLIDGYLQSCKDKNPLGPYLYARSILELGAFLADISRRAVDIYSKPDSCWRLSGEEFFSLIVRARFASSDTEKISIFNDLSNSQSKPINIMSSLKYLAEKNETAFFAKDYERLCDYVHHNLSSQITSSAGIRIDSNARSALGGMLLTQNSGPISRYEYPNPTKGELAAKETLSITEKSMALCISSLNSMPHSPYSQSLLIKRTGSAYGAIRLA